MSDALEPRLDKESLAVLRAIPECGDGPIFRERGVHETVTLWHVAEAIDSMDLRDVQLTLNGLVHLGYASHGESRSRKREVYWRTPKGDTAASGSNRELV